MLADVIRREASISMENFVIGAGLMPCANVSRETLTRSAQGNRHFFRPETACGNRKEI
jgi:hypothetical protein